MTCVTALQIYRYTQTQLHVLSHTHTHSFNINTKKWMPYFTHTPHTHKSTPCRGQPASGPRRYSSSFRGGGGQTAKPQQQQSSSSVWTRAGHPTNDSGADTSPRPIQRGSQSEQPQDETAPGPLQAPTTTLCTFHTHMSQHEFLHRTTPPTEDFSGPTSERGMHPPPSPA